MRLLARLSIGLVAVSLFAAEVNPKVFRLIGPDTRAVYGIDFERYQNSTLSHFLPVGPTHFKSRETGRLLQIESDQMDGHVSVTVFRGAAPTDDFIALDATTSIMGDEESVKAAIARWGGDTRLGELAIKAQRLSDSYDAWFLLVRPLDRLERSQPSQSLKYRKDIVDLADEVSGGIRFGTLNEVRVEIVAKTYEDAAALAVFGRYLPGLLQMNDSEGALLIDLVENLEIRANGRMVSCSFVLPERRVKEWAESLPGKETGHSLRSVANVRTDTVS